MIQTPRDKALALFEQAVAVLRNGGSLAGAAALASDGVSISLEQAEAERPPPSFGASSPGPTRYGVDSVQLDVSAGGDPALALPNYRQHKVLTPEILAALKKGERGGVGMDLLADRQPDGVWLSLSVASVGRLWSWRVQPHGARFIAEMFATMFAENVGDALIAIGSAKTAMRTIDALPPKVTLQAPGAKRRRAPRRAPRNRAPKK